ncbi:MAG: MarR family transcriptional regulator [Candidatus Kapaibacterium sp.]|nr:MAG: MarR family transcriptional regulator [Candidatus Kapabacteria bacterium]
MSCTKVSATEASFFHLSFFVMDFFQRAGKLAFGSYLRRLGEQMYQWSSEVYSLYELQLDVRYFPVFQSISWLEKPTVTAIAHYVGQTHAGVSQILKELAAQGYITLAKNSNDKRQTTITLTSKGKREQTRLNTLMQDLEGVITNVFAECATSPLAALQDFERAMQQRNLVERVEERRKQTMTDSISIFPLARRGSKRRTEQLAGFRALNYAWIQEYFSVEESDKKALDHAEEYIIKRGGTILCAERQTAEGREILGCVALVPHDEQTVELAKMAVSKALRGQNVGFLLGEAALQKAREMGAHRVYLESNTALKPAINLYYKLGFKRLANFTSPYERANIAMEIWL